MPRGELEEHIDQLPEMTRILSGDTVKITVIEDDDD